MSASNRYAGGVGWVVRHSIVALLVFGGLIGAHGLRVQDRARRVHSRAGQGLPDHRRSSFPTAPRWSEPMPSCGKATKMILETPGVRFAVGFAGFSGATRANSPNAGAIFVGPDSDRRTGRKRASPR